MRLTLLLITAALSACAKHPEPTSLSGSKWVGTFDINTPCEDGGYGGTPLQACMVFQATGGGVMTAAVDWDSENLRAECDYFAFQGAFDKSTLTLVRTDDDDALNLQFSGDTIKGTFQVSESCDAWPVTLARVR